MSFTQYSRSLCRLAPLKHFNRSECRFFRSNLWPENQKVEIATAKQDDEVAVRKKKPPKSPFVKNLFLGKFDPEFLTYPEVLNNEELQNLDEMISPLEKFFNQVNSQEIDKSSNIPEETLSAVKELGLFGQQIPTEYGGLGLTATEYARFAEITALDGSIAVTLAAHQAIGLKGILIAGNKEQKEKYLPRLASGELIAAYCLTEPGSGSDAASIKTKATLSSDGKTWILNGNKIWITNGGIASVFTVFAKTEVTNEQGKIEEKITAFIVERNFGGVTSGKPEDKLGIRGSNTCEVHFDNTPIPVENVLGKPGEGFKLAMNILNSGRFSMGSSSAGVLKKLMQITAEHAISRKQFGHQLKDFGLIQEKFAKIACQIYAMESMAYLTAGIIDEYENPDIAAEAAIVKVFSSENSWQAGSEFLQIWGGLGYMKSIPCERYLRDSRITMIFEGTNEILRLFIALMGLQHAGLELREIVKKLRNPMMNPGVVFKKLWERRSQNSDKPKLNLGLDYELHPSLKIAAKNLEYCVMRLKYAVEIALEKYGRDISNEQMELQRLANVAIDIYAMTAVLSRASRSYCIGLRNADEEILMAVTFCSDALKRVKANITEMINGPYYSSDSNYKKIASKIFESHGYFAEHPLKRNF
ncbi:complex I assembly factor ACAD9, mitochondrial-like [Hetaerina americana]|uniref:complex I assembly factor ACAD9, mitochondrial-like n=1 Tax=Hetaerina americana TaxID=62018 RepID=UPI003A7F505A